MKSLSQYIAEALIDEAFIAYYRHNRASKKDAEKFNFNTSILILVFVVLGGMGNIFGTIIATALLYMLPELLRDVGDFRMLIYAILLIAVMLLTNSSKAKLILENAKLKLRSIFRKNNDGEVGSNG